MSDINVLIIDDNEVDVKLILRLLKRSAHSCSVQVASNGHDALSLYKTNSINPESAPGSWPPSLVLLDINMPIMNGFEFLCALEAMNLPGLRQKLYILSSSNSSADRAKSTGRSLVAGYLVKPVAKQELEALLATI